MPAVARVAVEAFAAFFVTAALMNYGVASTAIGRWIASLQLIPAALSLLLPTLAFWLAVTLVFGRVYCSSVCPLGALMDLGARLRPESRPYRWSRPLWVLRAVSFAVVAVLLTLRVPGVSAWLDPYGLYASIVGLLSSPSVGLTALLGAALAGIIGFIAYRRGRRLCNSLCPLSAPLGLIARNSAFHIDINTDRCTQCRRCVDVCKASCIDLNDHVADMSRCVVCFNCLAACSDDAISYTISRHTLSHPLLQNISLSSCNNTSTCSATSSTTETAKPTEPEPEP